MMAAVSEPSDVSPTVPPALNDDDGSTVVSDGTSDLPVKILILGEMANGKSTLIRQLNIYAGNRNPDVRVGYGNVRCTKEVGRYSLSTTLQPYHLEDYSGHPIKGVNYSDLIDFTEDDAIVTNGVSDEGGKVFNYELIDTPGLDDSEGNDMEIMTNIIAKIGELTHLNAVIYVRSMSKPFGTAFVRFYEYIQRCMPMISAGLIVAHTSFTIDRVEEAVSRKYDLAAERRKAFDKATKGQMSLAHFFMDNNPDITNPFAVSESLNGCYKLLKFLSTQRPLDISNLRLLKAPNMANVDAHILLALVTHHRKIQTRLDGELAAATKSKKRVTRTKREIARLKIRKEEYEEELNELDRPTEILLGSKTVAEDYGFKEFLIEGKIWLDKKDVHFDSDSVIYRVQKSAGKGCKWLNEDRRGTSWRAKLTSNMFTSLEGSATFYTTSQLKHRGEIEHLKRRIREVVQDLAYQENELAELDAAEEADSALENLAEDVDRCSETIEKIQKDTFDAALWPLLRRFYVSHEKPSKSEIVEFVEVYDPQTADMLINI